MVSGVVCALFPDGERGNDTANVRGMIHIEKIHYWSYIKNIRLSGLSQKYPIFFNTLIIIRKTSKASAHR